LEGHPVQSNATKHEHTQDTQIVLYKTNTLSSKLTVKCLALHSCLGGGWKNYKSNSASALKISRTTNGNHYVQSVLKVSLNHNTYIYIQKKTLQSSIKIKQNQANDCIIYSQNNEGLVGYFS